MPEPDRIKRLPHGWYIKDSAVNYLTGLIVVLFFASMIYGFMTMPKEFRRGVLPEIIRIREQQEKRMNVLEENLAQTQHLLERLNSNIMPSCFVGRSSRKNLLYRTR